MAPYNVSVNVSGEALEDHGGEDVYTFRRCAPGSGLEEEEVVVGGLGWVAHTFSSSNVGRTIRICTHLPGDILSEEIGRGEGCSPSPFVLDNNRRWRCERVYSHSQSV